jgi:integrase
LVPDPTGVKPYISRSFADRAAGERWQLDAYAAIAADRPIPDPAPYRQGLAIVTGTSRRPQPRPVVSVGEVCERWWHQKYIDEPMSSPTRMVSTRIHIRRHIAPYFDAFVDDIGELTREHVRQFLQYLAGHDLDPTQLEAPNRPAPARIYTVTEAARACSVHPSTIKRALKASRFPNHTRRLVDGRTARNSVRIPAGDLLAAGFRLDHTDIDNSQRRGLTPRYCGAIYDTLRAALRLARAEGLLRHDPTEGLEVSTARPVVRNKKPNEEQSRAVTLGESKRIAAHLNIHHQVAFWLQRIVGLRISEAFGLLLGDVTDFGDIGLVAIRRQGGRKFVERDGYGNLITTDLRQAPKTNAGHRALGVAEPLMELLRVYVDAFHRDPDTGDVDPDSRLILGMRDPNTGGQQSYREALKAALVHVHLDFKHVGFHISTQELRKSFSVELSAYVDVSELTRSRYLGHRPSAHDGGARMTAAAYTPDMLDLEPFLTAGRGVGDHIRRQIGDLIVTPGADPNPGHDNRDPARAAHIRTTLAAAGWIEAPDGVDVEHAATQLGIAPLTLRRKIQRGEIEGVESVGAAGAAVTVIPDEEMDRLLETRTTPTGVLLPADAVTISDLAEQLGLDYHTVYQWTMTGRITARPHAGTRHLVVDPADVERELAEVARVAALRARSMTISQAAERIECGHSMIQHWLRRGELRSDEETDSNGVAYLTRESVEAKAAQQAAKRAQRLGRRPMPEDLVPLAEVQRRTGHTRHEIRKLVDVGTLTRRDHDRRYHIERASLDAYQTSRGLP